MSRSIFEEVGEDDAQGARTRPAPGAAEAKRAGDAKRTRIWLLVIAVMVIAQILIGGLTRLTDSGLSITQWDLVSGVLPPFSDAAWEAELERYRGTTEYQQQNAGMTMAEFKVIYWWEWAHRMWGRVIGLAFLIPFALFYLRGQLPEGSTARLAGIGALIVVQGVVGWWMVMSGLVGRLDVSQYRLALHLALAFALLGLLFWTALGLKEPPWAQLQARRRRESGPHTLMLVALGLTSAQIVMGAFVAGMDGGIVYTQWPGMGQGIFPANEPFHPFEEAAAAQFTHRKLGYVLLAFAIFAWFRMRRSAFAKTRLWANLLLGGIAVQSVIGVLTVVNNAPLSWSIVHQAGAIAAFTIVVHAFRQTAYPAEQRIERAV